jgi:hypothetical protein
VRMRDGRIQSDEGAAAAGDNTTPAATTLA